MLLAHWGGTLPMSKKRLNSLCRKGMQRLFLMKSAQISSTPGDLQLVATMGWGSTAIDSETWVCNLGARRVEKYSFQLHRTLPFSDCSTPLESTTEFSSSEVCVCPRNVIPSNHFQNRLGLDFSEHARLHCCLWTNCVLDCRTVLSNLC